ncbi:hypothetical protein THC_1603 [Caldimicrobium thiodismutans]|uniref:Uncharacterized protein n=1 Tax=Caldimicrobium thiodismutans TaxID=1653476 RepID=A0A0U5AZN9_9BACT|nr:hypothetical protein [Caldimicrobium thiodismutans]BAU23967.1 hypothetical protein THC_1603 [Caldimicrobium thiodismutans]
MYLRIIENKPLFRLLFKTRAEDVWALLEDLLLKHFEKKNIFLFEAQPEKIYHLNEIIHQLKDIFQKELTSAPPPYVFFLSKKNQPPPQSYLLRPGKIYFTSDLKKDLQDALSEIKLFFKIEGLREDLLELVLPATSEPNLILPYKEIFFSPKDQKCFFCRTYLHESHNCPGLEVIDIYSSYSKLLNYSLRELSEKIKANLLTEEPQDEILSLFFSRNFYLFPSFLRVVFYLYGEIDNFSMLGLNFSLPVKGGELSLALEDLIHRRFEQAERRFKAIEEEDFRKELGLSQIEFFKGDFNRALYYLESALSMVNTPFLKGFIYFYKGYIYHYLGDPFNAEENYKLSLKEDSSFFPSFYYLNLLIYEREELVEKIFPFFQHPYVIYLSFLEPVFIKHQKVLEEYLEKAMDRIREETVERLKEAEDKFHKIKDIMLEEEISEINEKLRKIRKEAYEGGIALVEKAGKRAMELALELNGYIFSKLKKYQKELASYKDRYQILVEFWNKYPYKAEDVYFGQRLKSSYEIMDKLSKLMKRSEIAKELKFIGKEITKLKQQLEDLGKLKPMLEKKWKFRKKLVKFIRNFSLAEAGLLLIYIIPMFYQNLNLLGPFLSLPYFFLFSFLLFLIVLILVQFED